MVSLPAQKTRPAATAQPIFTGRLDVKTRIPHHLEDRPLGGHAEGYFLPGQEDIKSLVGQLVSNRFDSKQLRMKRLFGPVTAVQPGTLNQTRRATHINVLPRT